MPPEQYTASHFGKILVGATHTFGCVAHASNARCLQAVLRCKVDKSADKLVLLKGGYNRPESNFLSFCAEFTYGVLSEVHSGLLEVVVNGPLTLKYLERARVALDFNHFNHYCML